MKRIDLIKILNQAGCILVRHGSEHDWYQSPATGICQPVPRHREITKFVARSIIRLLTQQSIDSQDNNKE